tara:strand:+ start:1302 stop:1631 length:330 start_codon:yes stop_codon:yes gene_type:complete
MALSNAEKSRRYRERHRERVAAQEAKRNSKPANKKATAARVKAYRLSSKLRNACTLLDDWPYCHWRALTDTPCRRKPCWIYLSTPVCAEHAKEFPSVDPYVRREPGSQV